MVRVGLLLIPTVVLGLLQAEDQIRLREVWNQLGTTQLQQGREAAVRAQESRPRETFVLEPIGAIENGENADQGFLIKSYRLRVSAFEQEAALMLDHPEMAETILRFPESPHSKVKSYDQLKAENPRQEFAIEAVLETLRQEAAYLDAASLFRSEIKPQYRRLQIALKNHTILAADACDKILRIQDTLRRFAAIHQIAGLLNHIGTMALSCGQPQQALGLFYTALASDNMHVTVYESLSYALWIINKDSENALENADQGLRVCRGERGSLRASYLHAVQMYESIGRRMPSYAPLVSRRIVTLRKDVVAIERRWEQFIDNLTQRLTNDFSYFSALELKNEKEARSYMTDLYNSDPNNPDYQDSLGFVFMRFATNETELEKAKQLFTAAVRNLSAEPETVRLASVHLQEVQMYRTEFQGRDGSLPKYLGAPVEASERK